MLINPFDPQRFIGYVSKVSPESIQVQFPSSKLLKKFYYDGDTLYGGIVRSFFVIEGDGYGFLAKIFSIELPEKEKMRLSETSFQSTELHPLGRAEIQLCFDYFESGSIKKGLDHYPPVGAKVYVCPPTLLQAFVENFGKPQNQKEDVDDLLELALLGRGDEHSLCVSANALFGRHCAIVGTTGGGKSYTIAKLLEEINKKKGMRVILLDPTGEFSGLPGTHHTLGKDSYFHYKNLQMEDYYALFRPAGQVQLPKLQEAMQSLRVVFSRNKEGPVIDNDTSSPSIQDGYLSKVQKEKRNYLNFLKQNQGKLKKSDLHIKNLPRQIIEECVEDWGTGKWEKLSQRERDNCASLSLRVDSLIQSDRDNKVFNFQENLSGSCVIDELSIFLEKPTSNLFIVDLQLVPKDSTVSSILVNAIGRHLLHLARENRFKENPVVVFLDEAHLFLNKRIKDEYSIETVLDAFDSIAKECRKYGLFLCLSTQRPRDLPVGVLSQMGTFVVHRLINNSDIEAVQNASPEGSRHMLSFLPDLGEGEAVLIGVGFPMPIHVKVKKPMPGNEPLSNTPILGRSRN